MVINNKKFGEDGFHQLSDKDVDNHVNFICEYIDKKLGTKKKVKRIHGYEPNLLP